MRFFTVVSMSCLLLVSQAEAAWELKTSLPLCAGFIQLNNLAANAGLASLIIRAPQASVSQGVSQERGLDKGRRPCAEQEPGEELGDAAGEVAERFAQQRSFRIFLKFKNNEEYVAFKQLLPTSAAFCFYDYWLVPENVFKLVIIDLSSLFADYKTQLIALLRVLHQIAPLSPEVQAGLAGSLGLSQDAVNFGTQDPHLIQWQEHFSDYLEYFHESEVEVAAYIERLRQKLTDSRLQVQFDFEVARLLATRGRLPELLGLYSLLLKRVMREDSGSLGCEAQDLLNWSAWL